MKIKLMSLFVALIGVMPLRGDAEEEAASLLPQLSAEEQAKRDHMLEVMNDRIRNRLPQFSMTGELELLGGNRYAVQGESFETDDKTNIQGTLEAGATVEVRGFISPGKPKVANQITVADSAGAGAVSALPEVDPLKNNPKENR